MAIPFLYKRQEEASTPKCLRSSHFRRQASQHTGPWHDCENASSKSHSKEWLSPAAVSVTPEAPPESDSNISAELSCAATTQRFVTKSLTCLLPGWRPPNASPAGLHTKARRWGSPCWTNYRFGNAVVYQRF